jgi:hypothetical protein
MNFRGTVAGLASHNRSLRFISARHRDLIPKPTTKLSPAGGENTNRAQPKAKDQRLHIV